MSHTYTSALERGVSTTALCPQSMILIFNNASFAYSCYYPLIQNLAFHHWVWCSLCVCPGMLHFIMLCRYFFFYRLKVCVTLHQGSLLVPFFFPNNICSLCVSLSHSGNSCDISKFFITIIFVTVIWDQWSLALLH